MDGRSRRWLMPTTHLHLQREKWRQWCLVCSLLLGVLFTSRCTRRETRQIYRYIHIKDPFLATPSTATATAAAAAAAATATSRTLNRWNWISFYGFAFYRPLISFYGLSTFPTFLLFIISTDSTDVNRSPLSHWLAFNCAVDLISRLINNCLNILWLSLLYSLKLSNFTVKILNLLTIRSI